MSRGSAVGDDSSRMPRSPAGATPPVPDAAELEALRPLLFTVAYEMLEVAADAEDVVQEAWLRWSRVDPTTVRDPRAYLVRVVIRLSLNRFRTLSRQRETYVGPWLPEPILTVPDVADDVELAESVSTAMLLVLQSLTPVERAVFVLREVFDVPYDEIAQGVDRTPAAVRQIAHRAREHVAARRPRQRVGRSEHAAVLERFRIAADTGDLQALVDVLSPDVVLVTDGGGVRQAALRPILGREKVLRFLDAVTPRDVAVELRVESVGGLPGLVAVVDGVVDSVITIDVVDGRVGSLYFVRNPDKLTRLDDEVRLAR
ncbi:MAG TPA: RNA polymerase sigma-70 factor [Ornithinibacter sp.]|nr:RNA polymerase sigma-70 factor [Ornithinibacter sp.]